MNDEVPDLSAGPKLNELSHAALAAVQIASGRRDAADRSDGERAREVENRLADLRRARTEWRCLTDVTSRAGDRMAEARFDTALTSRTAAVSRQRHDGAILDYHEALAAPTGSVPRWRLDALERAVGETGRQSERDDALAQRAADRYARAAKAFGGAEAAVREFEQEHGITPDPVERPDPPRTVRDGTDTSLAAQDGAVAADDRRQADVWAGVRVDGATAGDQVGTQLDEREVSVSQARAADGLQAVKLVDLDAATAAALAHAIAFPVQGSADAVEHANHAATASSDRHQSRASR